MSRFPIRTRAAAVAALGLLFAVFTQAGLDLTGWQEVAAQAVNFLVLIGVLTVTAESQVTPVADPRANDGSNLVKEFVPELDAHDVIGV